MKKETPDIKRHINTLGSIEERLDYLKDIYFTDSNYRKISKNLILNVVKSRIDEIVVKTKKELIVPGFNLTSGISFLLSGEGLNLLNIKEYFASFFGSGTKIKNENNSNNYDNLEKKFNACLGAIRIIKDGWETEAIPKISDRNLEKIGFFARIFGIRQ